MTTNMTHLVVVMCVALSLITLSLQVSTPASTTYVAGVVEFARNENFSKTIDERIADNLDQYIKKIKEANTKDVDIIVFPEDTLNLAQSNNRSIILAQTTAVPDPQDRVVPYLSPPNTYKNVLTEVSREAKQSNMYVVVNLAEKSLCNSTQQSPSKDQPCAPDGFNIFNTNVVFDRNGTVVSRYRKFNLFGEPGFNATAVSDISNFTTDFGVTFGHFICFDIMFSTPALNLVRGGIRHFLFPSMWFSELPFLTGVQVQENWAIANDVVLLAAGASNPHVGSGGSGIYVGKSGSLKSLMNGKDTQQLIVATVPKAAGTLPSDNELPAKRQNETYEALDNLKLKRDDIDVYSTKPLEKSGFNNATLCSFSHCCTFEVNTTVLDVPKDKDSYKYRLAVFNGVRTFSGIRTGGVTICAIVACSGTKLSTCGIRFQNYSTVVPSVVFNHVKISGNFPNRSSVLIIPNTLTHAILPLARNQFNYTVSSDQTNHQLVLTDSVNNLQTFGIYGRDFEKDGRPVTRNSSSRTFVELVVLSVTVIPFLFSKMC